MSKQFVWCKLKKQLWWVGEKVEDPPEHVVDTQKKHTKAIVHFPSEKSYHYVTDLATMVPYETDKEDYVRKGLQHLISMKSQTLELFKSDVLNAEKVLGGDTGIIERLQKEEPPKKIAKKSIVAEIFKPIPVTPVKTPPPPSARVPKKTVSPVKKSNSKGPTPQLREENQKALKYKCDVPNCEFSSGRVNVINAHRKMHTGESTPAPRKSIGVGKSSPARKSTAKTPRGSKATVISTTPAVISSPTSTITPKRGRGRPPASAKVLLPQTLTAVTEKIPRSPKKKRASPKKEIAKEEILADWSDEDDEDAAKPTEDSLPPPQKKTQDYGLLFESLLQKKTEITEENQETPHKMEIDVQAENPIKNNSIETDKNDLLLPKSDVETSGENVGSEVDANTETEKVKEDIEAEDFEARFEELMQETAVEIPSFDLKGKHTPKKAHTSTEEDAATSLNLENPEPVITRSTDSATENSISISSTDVAISLDDKVQDGVRNETTETPNRSQKSTLQGDKTPVTHSRTTSRTRSKVTQSPVISSETPVTRGTRRASIRNKESSAKKEEQKQSTENPVKKGQKSLPQVGKEQQSPIIEEPQNTERTGVAGTEEGSNAASESKPVLNEDEKTVSELSAASVVPIRNQPTVYAKKSLPQFVEEKPQAVTRSGRRTSSTFARIPAVLGTSKAPLPAETVTPVIATHTVSTKPVETPVTASPASVAPAVSVDSKQKQLANTEKLTEDKQVQEKVSANIGSTESCKTPEKAVVVTSKKSSVSPLKPISTKIVVQKAMPTLTYQGDTNGAKNTTVRTPIAAIAESVVKTPAKGTKRKQTFCSTPDSTMNPELEGPPAKQRNQNQASAEQDTKPILEPSPLTPGKPIAAIKPTVNDDDSIIRQALQGTMKSSPNTEKKETQAVEAPLEQVVHLVPVENSDGTVTYMILSLDDHEQLKVDSVVATGGELDPELDAVYLDKTVDCQTLLQSIHVPPRQQQSSTAESQPQVQFIQSPEKQLASQQIKIVPSSSNSIQQVIQSPTSSSSTEVQPILIQQQDGTQEIVNFDPSALVGADQGGFLQSDGSILLVMGDGGEPIDPSSCGVDLQQFYNTQ